MIKNENLKNLWWIGGVVVLLVLLLLLMKPIEKYYLVNHKDYSSYELDFKGENLLFLLAKAEVIEETANTDGTDTIYTLDPTYFDAYVPEDVQVISVTNNKKFIIIQYIKGNEIIMLGYENGKLVQMYIENETRGIVTHIYNGEVTVTDI